MDEPKAPKMPEFNRWMAVSAILAVLLISSVAIQSTGISGMSISEKEAGEKAVSYIKANFGVDANIVDTGKENGLYYMDLMIEDQKFKMYMSEDGELLFPQVFVLSSEPAEIAKVDRPKVDLFIFSYCPAGSAALDALAPVANLLKDSADFNVKFFSDMHGEHELQQNKIQACIQNVAGDKYWAYADQFYEKVYSKCAQTGDTTCDMDESVALMDLVEIDSDMVLACVEQNGDALYAADTNEAINMQLQYSPSFIVNDVYEKNMDRSPDGIKDYVCSTFNDAPSQCEGTLSEQATSAGSCS